DPVIWNPATGGFGKETHAEAAALAEHDKATAGQEAVHQEGSAAAPLATRSEGEGEHGAAPLPYGDNGFNLAHSIEGTLGHAGTEWLFILISLVAAGVGMLLAAFFYVWRPHLPALWAARLAPLYRASFNKYWVDELYGVLVTRRTMDAARGVYQFDSKIVDGAVNGIATVTRRLSRLTGDFDRIVVDGAVNGVAGFIRLLMSPLLRAAQTGLTANYALVMVLGLVVAVAIFFGKDLFGR
ncbi:MAG: hypothetical protein WCD76_11960, partial [Pyrinomonadaceae bacterium]